MCTTSELNIIINEISQCAKNTFGQKVCDVILYGSYARGDYNSESDIDIIVLVDLPPKELYKHKKPFHRLSSDLGIEYDVVITISLKDIETFNKYLNVLPYYQNKKRRYFNINLKVFIKRNKQCNFSFALLIFVHLILLSFYCFFFLNVSRISFTLD